MNRADATAVCVKSAKVPQNLVSNYAHAHIKSRNLDHTIDSIPYGHGIGNSYIKVQPFKDTPHLHLNQHILRNNYM